jgi:hypothetical protein
MLCTYLHGLGILVKNTAVLVVCLTIADHESEVLPHVAEAGVFFLFDTRLNLVHADWVLDNDIVIRIVPLGW